MSLIEPLEYARHVNDGEEVARGLFIAAGDCPEAFDVMEEALDIAAKAVEVTILASPIVLAAGIHRDDGLHAPSSYGVDDPVGVVARICDERFAGRMLDERFSLDGIVLLAGGQDDVERLALRVRERVDLGRKASSRTAQSIASDPPFPPAASWCARTTEPSMSAPSSSTSSWSALNIRSHTPRFDQRSKRLYMDFQLPYRSGISRHGAPVFSRHMTALTKLRSPRNERGPRRTGMNLSTSFHCSSVSSCRCTGSVDQILDRGATSISEINPKPNSWPPAPRADQKIRDTP